MASILDVPDDFDATAPDAGQVALARARNFVRRFCALPDEHALTAATLWAALPSLSWPATLVAVATMALIVLFRRLAHSLPGLIVAVALTSAAVTAFGLPVETLASRFGPLPDSLPWPSLPRLDAARLVELLPSALVIAFLAGVESLLSAMVADRMIDDRHKPNAELLAQGAANLGSSLFGGLPATGAIARTATNVRAGGRTPVAGLVHALAVLLALLTVAPLIGYMAMPALAGLLLLTAWNMSEPHKWRGYLGARRSDVVLLGLTLGLTVLADLTVAIGVGVALGLALRLQRRNVPPSDWSEPER